MGVTERPVAPRSLTYGHLVLRQLSPEDAPAMTAAVNASLDHLRRFMRWAQEPAVEERTALRLAVAAEAMDAGGDAEYGLFLAAAPEVVVGSAGLHRRRGAGTAPDIGYWVHVGWLRQGIATRAAAALASLALGPLGDERVEIHCDTANVASAAVARKLGFRHVRTVDDSDGAAPGDAGTTMVWELGAGEWRSSSAAASAAELRIEPSWVTPPTC